MFFLFEISASNFSGRQIGRIAKRQTLTWWIEFCGWCPYKQRKNLGAEQKRRETQQKDVVNFRNLKKSKKYYSWETEIHFYLWRKHVTKRLSYHPGYQVLYCGGERQRAGECVKIPCTTCTMSFHQRVERFQKEWTYWHSPNRCSRVCFDSHTWQQSLSVILALKSLSQVYLMW